MIQIDNTKLECHLSLDLDLAGNGVNVVINTDSCITYDVFRNRVTNLV
jgi:hypothetical protein